MSEEMNFYDDNATESSERISAPVIEETTDESSSSGIVDTLLGAEDSSEEGDKLTSVEPVTYTVSADILGDFSMDDEDDDDDDLATSPEERLASMADSLLSSCVKLDSEINRYAIDRLMMLPSPAMFRDENYIIFSVLFNYRGRLRSIRIDEEFIRLYLNRNRKLISDAKHSIDINAYGEIDGSVELGYISGVIKHYRRLKTLDNLDIQDFETILEKYKIEFRTMEAEKAYQQARIILSDGITIGNKKYFGFDDSQNYIRRKLAEIDGLVNMASGTGFTTHREMLTNAKVSKTPVKIGDYGKLKKLNDVYGGIYTGSMIEVIAPPKAGKSKFVTRLTHNIAVEHGNNVTVWAQEGGNDAFLAQLRAIHFDYCHNKGADLKDKKYGVSQDAILHDRFPNDALRQLEMSSKIDLATNQDYGSIDFIDKPFEVETFLDDIDTSVKSNGSVAVIIDYLQIISSAKNKSEREAVSDAYKRVLAYCKLNNITVITPAQYKQEVFDRLIELKNTDSADMRTSGGVSSEVVRTPDIIFAFWATTEDIRNNRMKILSMPCRFNKPFPEIDVVTNFETCQFMSGDND